MADIYHWNPRRSLLPGRFGVYTKLGPRLSNFGDLLGPMVVHGIERGISASRSAPGREGVTLFSVGSVLHEARDGDVVWGSGINGKKRPEQHRFARLDVRAVRGRRTAEYLTRMGVDVPEVYGDPALLIPRLFPEVREWAKTKTRKIAVVPNFNEQKRYRSIPGFVSPLGDPMKVIRAIAQSETVVGSSLHAIVIAESLGIQALAFESGVEPSFKYEDYFTGTGRGRGDYLIASDVQAAIDGVVHQSTSIPWDPEPLARAFPSDLWVATPVKRYGQR